MPLEKFSESDEYRSPCVGFVKARRPPMSLMTALLLPVFVPQPVNSQVELLSAGHGPLLFYSAATGTVQRFDAHAVPFGVMAGLPWCVRVRRRGGCPGGCAGRWRNGTDGRPALH